LRDAGEGSPPAVGLLAYLPGGEVASLNGKEQAVIDPPWKTPAARRALRAPAPVSSLVRYGSQPRPLSFNLPARYNKTPVVFFSDSLAGSTIQTERPRPSALSMSGNPIPSTVPSPATRRRCRARYVLLAGREPFFWTIVRTTSVPARSHLSDLGPGRLHHRRLKRLLSDEVSPPPG